MLVWSIITPLGKDPDFSKGKDERKKKESFTCDEISDPLWIIKYKKKRGRKKLHNYLAYR